MGLLAEFFIATSEQAVAYGAGQRQPGMMAAEDVAAYGDLIEIHIAQLWAILAQRAFVYGRPPLNAFDDGEGETWLVGFPDQLVQLLAALDDNRLTEVQQLWAQSEDMSCEAGQLGPVLVDLRRLAQQALAQDKGLYLWGSL